VRAYLALFRARFRALLQYRAAAVAGFFTQLFFGLIRVMILRAFYSTGGGDHAVPMTLAQAVGYTWLGQAFFHLLPFSANPDPDVRDMIRSGEIVYELARPLDLHTLWLSRALAMRIAPTLMRAVPMLLLALVLLGLQPPASLVHLGAATLALTAAAFLTATFATVVTATLMWTISGEGIARIVPSLVMLGAGLVVPLPLFPTWVQPLFDLLPFRGMADDPFRLYLGLIAPSTVGIVLLRQVTWALVFVLLGRVLVARGQRNLVLQGG
jgi:ABC-2 type transport system permease protein